VHEIVPLEQRRLARRTRQGVSKAVAEIQPCRVTAAPAKIAICLARYLRLDLGNRFDDQLRLLDEIVKAAAGDRVPASINDDCAFDKIRSRNAALGSCLNGFGAGRRLGLIAKDRDQRRCVDDHRGNLLSS
jgi:hypothetical protein